MRAFFAALVTLSVGCSGAPAADATFVAHPDGVPGSPADRGLLANPILLRQPVKSAYFFAGNWRKGWTQFYEHPTDDNTALYTLYPTDPRHLGWSESEADRSFALDELGRANVNTVTMSYWGKRGDDRWEFWAPMHTSTYAHDQLFNEASQRNMVIMPAIESGRCVQGLWKGWDGIAGHPRQPNAWQGTSWSFNFASEFPWFVPDPRQNANNPSPLLVAQVEDLIARYLKSPANPAWPSRWAQIFDRTGQPRYAINLIHVASNQLPAGSDGAFARGFAEVAARVLADTGVAVGFTLDIVPTAARVDQNCGTSNDPNAFWLDTFNAAPETTGPPLRDTDAVLAVQAFIPEVWSGVIDDQPSLQAWKRDFIRRWVANGPPVFLDIDPGYAAHEGFDANRPISGWGWNDAWLNFQSELKATGIRGITFNTWNGYTEGYAGMSVTRNGTVDGRANAWLTNMYAVDPQLCDHWQFVNGAATYHVYGAICAKWGAKDGSVGVLGAPQSSEYAVGCRTGARENDFTYGHVVWTPARGAFEVHGAIFQLWRQMGGSCGAAGLPLSDEQVPTSGPHSSVFENGTITWTSGGGAVWIPNR
jgi:hypothetical protein